MAGWADNQPTGRPRRIHLHFWTRPLQLLGVTHVSGVEIEKRSPGSHSPEVSVLDAQLVLRAIGYQAHPLPEVPFDADRAVVPNDAGRVIEPAGDRAGEYVAGWLKRGPTGLIGTNRNDAAETVRQLEADLPTLPPRPVTDPDAIIELLHDRGVRFVDWAGWQRLERHEAALGALRNTTTVKVADWKAMLDIAHSLAEAD
jgi:ferredoxin--NADP+ reductase